MFRHSSTDTCQSRRKPRLDDVVHHHSESSKSFLLEDDDMTSSWTPNSRHDIRRTRNGSVCDAEEPDTETECDLRKRLLIESLKKNVKMIMEEAVTKRTIDLNSPYVCSLCASIDACLLDGLRRRLLGLFGSRSSFALLHSLAKHNKTAQDVLTEALNSKKCGSIAPHLVWIREALHMRVINTIVDLIANTKNFRRLYDAQALILDRAKGGMVSALLLGPCAVTFRRMSDKCEETSAEELIEATTRNRINGAIDNSPPSQGKANGNSRPPLSITRQGSSIVSSLDRHGSVSRDYVYSLHHNFKSNLLYGKNNVSVVAVNGKDPVKGYLSLHKNYDANLTLKWVPNQLMHASSQPSSAHSNNLEFSNFWKHAINIDLFDIIYIHLHQKEELSPAVFTFVNCDGVQSAPLQLPAGQHSIAFLSSLETGLLPSFRLDPPLSIGKTKEKVLPRLRKRSTATSKVVMMDFVFRIVKTSGNEVFSNEAVNESDNESCSSQPQLHETCVSLPNSPYIKDNVDNLVNFHINKACKSMQNQILARAFYGWLTYVRHLKTIRTHLLDLVNANSFSNCECTNAVDQEFWDHCYNNQTDENWYELLKRVYWSGIETKHIRRQAWPYILGVFTWNEPIGNKMEMFDETYRKEIEEWKILEEEVRRRDEEAFLAARAKKATSPVRESSILSEVFEDDGGECSSNELIIQQFMTNLHRIDKDVERCDRNLSFFSNRDNLDSLRRIMCTYIRRNLEEGYIQGMCDILAPLLVIFEDEALTLECFTVVMRKLRDNFPQRSGMDKCFSNFRSLIQVVDPQIFSMLTSTTDFTSFYFSYRWFLLDFKRELSYDCTYKVWETIWAARCLNITEHFALFFALAIVENYRDVVITNNMDFTDMIKFFNEMAERHDCSRLLSSARTHVKCLQNLVQNLK